MSHSCPRFTYSLVFVHTISSRVGLKYISANRAGTLVTRVEPFVLKSKRNYNYVFATLRMYRFRMEVNKYEWYALTKHGV